MWPLFWRRPASLLLPLIAAAAACSVEPSPTPPVSQPWVPPSFSGGAERLLVDVTVDPPVGAPGAVVVASVRLVGAAVDGAFPGLSVWMEVDGSDHRLTLEAVGPDLVGSVDLTLPDVEGPHVVAVRGGWTGGEVRGGSVVEVQSGDPCEPGFVHEVGTCVPEVEGHAVQLDGLAIVNNGRQGRAMIHPRRLAFVGDDLLGCFSDSVGLVRTVDLADPFGPPGQGPDPLDVPVVETLLTEHDLDFCQDLAHDVEHGVAVVAGRGTSGRGGFLATIGLAAPPQSAPPTVRAIAEDQAGWEGVAMADGLVFATRKPDKLDIFSLQPDGALEPLGAAVLDGALAAWSLVLDGTRLYVIDAGAHLDEQAHAHSASAAPHPHPQGTGRLYVVDVAAPDDPEVLGWTPLAGIPKGLAVLPDAVLAIANGAEGIELVDVRSPEQPLSLAVIDTPGSVMDVAADGGYLVAADWMSVRLYETSHRDTLVLLDAHEGLLDQSFAPPMARGGIGSAMDVELTDGVFVVGDFNSIWHGRIDVGRRAPRLVVLDRATTAPPGASEEQRIRVHNAGTAMLEVEVEASPSVEPGATPRAWVLPGETDEVVALVTVPSQEGVGTAVRIRSNDPEAAVRQAVVSAVDEVQPGEAAPHFMLPYTNVCDANGCDLSTRCLDSEEPQQSGKPMLLAYFASW